MENMENGGKRSVGALRRFCGRLKKGLTGKLFFLLLGVLLFMAAWIVIYSGGVDSFYMYIELPLLVWMVLLFIFVMYMTGIWKDFLSGFRLVFSKGKNVTRMELQKAAKAMKFASKLTVLESVIAVCLQAVDLLYHMEVPWYFIGPLLSVLFLGIIYSCLFSLIVIPIRVRLENMTISFMEETGEGQEQDGAQDDGQTVYFRLRAMGLTDREAEVARLVCCGLANKEIGQILYISDTTVKKHMTHILEKTKCDSREALTELVMKQNE